MRLAVAFRLRRALSRYSQDGPMQTRLHYITYNSQATLMNHWISHPKRGTKWADNQIRSSTCPLRRRARLSLHAEVIRLHSDKAARIEANTTSNSSEHTEAQRRHISHQEERKQRSVKNFSVSRFLRSVQDRPKGPRLPASSAPALGVGKMNIGPPLPVKGEILQQRFDC